MKNLIVVAALFFSMATEAAFTVSRVSLQQRWPWNGKVDIHYALESDDGGRADVDVRLYDGETPLDVPQEAFSGDVKGVEQGIRRITFDPAAAGLGAVTLTSVSAVISARPADALYLIVDLTKQKGDADIVTYVTEKDLAGGAYGTVATNPVSGVSSIAWTGVTNDLQYATTKYVLRRVKAGTFMMGANNKKYNADYAVYTNEVSITKDFYIGVFETTQKQWELVMGSNPSYFTMNGDTRPVEGIKYADVRGKNVAWPADGYGKAQSGTFLQKLCEKTGLVFDLPTFAQWQYASSCALTRWYNTGKTPKAANWSSGDEADECARYSGNGGGSVPSPTDGAVDYSLYDVDQGTAKVGSYRCNAIGLYDMHGNVWEFVLDYYNTDYDYPASCSDPEGAATGSTRMWCGGAFSRDGRYLRLGFRGGYSVPLEQTNETYLRESGFRAIAMP